MDHDIGHLEVAAFFSGPVADENTGVQAIGLEHPDRGFSVGWVHRTQVEGDHWIAQQVAEFLCQFLGQRRRRAEYDDALSGDDLVAQMICERRADNCATIIGSKGVIDPFENVEFIV